MLEPVQRAFSQIGDYSAFAVRATWKGFRHPLRFSELSEHLFFIGWQSLPVVLFAGFFAGLSQTLFLESELDSYGAKMTIGRVLAVTAIRELGTLVVGLMFIGRVGAAFAAEIGSMKVNNQVDAITALGQDYERKLATPRVFAMTLVALPVVLLTVLAVVFGGWVVSTVSSGMFWYQAQMAVYARHVTSMLVKPFFFGWMISTLACWYGLRTEGGVKGVGEAVSKTVVTACIWLFIVNALLGIVMLAIFRGLKVADPMVVFDHVRFAYGSNVVLEDVSFGLAEGETLVILGGSGSGKSTILRLLMGFIEARSGRILFEDEDITHVDEERLVELRQKMGMVFQEGALFDSLTVGENVGYWLLEHEFRGRRLKIDEVEKRVRETLALVGLEHTIDAMPSELSGGMRRRVAAARTLIYHPDLILYDEPTTGLDPATCENFCKVMNDIKARGGVTGILVTHNLEDALKVGDAFLLLRDGRALWYGRKAELKGKGDEFLMKFFRGEKL